MATSASLSKVCLCNFKDELKHLMNSSPGSETTLRDAAEPAKNKAHQPAAGPAGRTNSGQGSEHPFTWWKRSLEDARQHLRAAVRGPEHKEVWQRNSGAVIHESKATEVSRRGLNTLSTRTAIDFVSLNQNRLMVHRWARKAGQT